MRTKATLGGFLLLALAAGGSGSGGEATRSVTTVVHIQERNAAAPRLTLLEVVEYSPERVLRRLLVRGAESERLVLSSVIRPREGVTDLEALDDTSRWRASMHQESGLKFASSDELAQPGVWAGRFVAKDHPLRWTFEAPRVPSFSLDSTTWDEGFAERYAAEFEATGLQEELLLAMPSAMRSVMAVLGPLSVGEQGVGTPLAGFGDLIAFLGRQVGEPAQNATPDLLVSVEVGHIGLTPSTELERALVLGFSSLPHQDLLSDLRGVTVGRRQLKP